MKQHSDITISVVICTRNRYRLLQKCLNSLRYQIMKPYEIIVVDNGSTDSTMQICKKMRKYLPLKYFFEPKIGIPFGRNTGIRKAHGNICAFIDDDCEAEEHWIGVIYEHFKKHIASEVVVGLSLEHADSIISNIEQAFYERWFLDSNLNLKSASIILSNTIMDFKNAAIRSDVIKKLRFSTDVPFGDIGDEDIEIGQRIYKICKSIWFLPTLNVTHHNSPSIIRALYRNFWKGFANEMLTLQKLNLLVINTPHNKFHWYFHTINKQTQKRSILQTLVFVLFFLVYPIFSKTGRLVAKMSWMTGILIKIPQRS